MPLSSAAAAASFTVWPARTLVASATRLTDGGASSKPVPKLNEMPPPQPVSSAALMNHEAQCISACYAAASAMAQARHLLADQPHDQPIQRLHRVLVHVVHGL